MHKCPHCKQRTISTFKKLMPGWRPRCTECGGRWRTNYLAVMFFMAGQFSAVPLMLFLIFGGYMRPGLGPLYLITTVIIIVSGYLFYALPVVKK